jgi:preprotein translocase subunit YajC
MPTSFAACHALPPVAFVPPVVAALGLPAHAATAILAQAGPAGPEGPPDIVRTLMQTLPIALVVLAAYMLLFRPEREKQRRQQELLAGLKKNDRVLTSSGIYGTVANVDREGDRVSLKVDDAANVKITVTLSSIARVLADRHSGDTDTTRTSRDES